MFNCFTATGGDCDDCPKNPISSVTGHLKWLHLDTVREEAAEAHDDEAHEESDGGAVRGDA